MVLSLTFASCGGEEKAPVVEETTTETTTEETTAETEVAPATEDAPVVVEKKKSVKKVTKIVPKQMSDDVKEGPIVTKANGKKPPIVVPEVNKNELQTIDKPATEIKSRQNK